MIYSYPGGICYDSLGQIAQVLGESPYSAHHPLLATLLMGLPVRLSYTLTGKYGPGLFVYILFQTAALAASIAFAVFSLARAGRVSHSLLAGVTGIAILSPMYSNLASMAIRDAPYVAAVIVWFVLLSELMLGGDGIWSRVRFAWYVAASLAVCLLRNNGLYMVILTGLIVMGAFRTERGDEVDGPEGGGAAEKKGAERHIAVFLIGTLGAAFAAVLINAGLRALLSAEESSVAEALAIPFQQSARYVREHPERLSAEERAGYEAFFGGAELLADAYDQALSDPVKALYYRRAEETGEAASLVEYFRLWALGLRKAPVTYLEAFFQHIHGWFDPELTNAPRYETGDSYFSEELLFGDSDKVLVFLYRFAARITPLAALENVGLYTWALLALCVQLRRERRREGWMMVPLLLSLLICLASPGFDLHPRYAYPYLFCLPYYYALAYRRERTEVAMETEVFRSAAGEKEPV